MVPFWPPRSALRNARERKNVLLLRLRSSFWRLLLISTKKGPKRADFGRFCDQKVQILTNSSTKMSAFRLDFTVFFRRLLLTLPPHTSSNFASHSPRFPACLLALLSTLPNEGGGRCLRLCRLNNLGSLLGAKIYEKYSKNALENRYFYCRHAFSPPFVACFLFFLSECL